MYIINALLDGTDVEQAVEQSRHHWKTREQLLNRVKRHEISDSDQQPGDRLNNLPAPVGDRPGC